jgi:hypothetical protein
MRARSDDGVGLLGLVVSLLILAAGLLVPLVLMGDGAGGTGAGAGSALSPSGGSGSLSGLAGDAQAAQVAVCQADYQQAETSAEASRIASGASGAVTGSGVTLPTAGGTITGAGFTITVSPGGQVEVAAPGHPATPGAGNCAYVR